MPQSLLLSNDLQGVEKQLLDEWKRFKQVSLNNHDPNFKPQVLTKLFQTSKAANNASPEKRVNNETAESEFILQIGRAHV